MNKQEFRALSPEKKHIIERMARLMLHQRFDIIPNVLFENHKKSINGEYDEILSPVIRDKICPHCGDNDLTRTDEDIDNDTWSCGNCDADAESTDLEYSDLEDGLLCGWPGAHAYSWWTTEWNNNERFVDCAASAGFIVYEPQDFDGYVLSIDGGGYSFMDDHWIPLYLYLGFTWHEREPDWPRDLTTLMPMQKVKVYTGPVGVKEYCERYGQIFGHDMVFDGTEHVYICGKSKDEAIKRLTEYQKGISTLLHMVEAGKQIKGQS
jgi:hypothetical protein